MDQQEAGDWGFFRFLARSGTRKTQVLGVLWSLGFMTDRKQMRLIDLKYTSE